MDAAYPGENNCTKNVFSKKYEVPGKQKEGSVRNTNGGREKARDPSWARGIFSLKDKKKSQKDDRIILTTGVKDKQPSYTFGLS